MKALQKDGYELMIADESLFSPNSYDRSKHWARAGQPMRKLRKFATEKPIMAFGVIGPTLGNILYHLDDRSFNSQDMESCLRKIREIAG